MRAFLISLILSPLAAAADPALIVDAKARFEGTSWRFDVSVSHADTGWEDYADAWEVRLEDGRVVGTRILAHPHVNEQPFTRSLSGVVLPHGTDEVLLFVRETRGGWASEPFRLSLESP
ncbi:MAG: hypothetical protein AAF647_02905 [Pseudomonadota bacterium]